MTSKPDSENIAVAFSNLGKERPRSLKASERVARDLATYIVDQRLVEGTPLPAEKDMVESLGVGRNTLREALRLLETRGAIRIRSGPGGGPIVRRPRPSDLGESLSMILQFEGATFREVIEARSWLEPLVARNAATRITKTAVAALREVNSMIAAAADMDGGSFPDLNQRFHSIIAENCGNIVLWSFADTLLSIGHGDVVGITYASRQIAAIVEAHEEIITALDAKDPDAAEEAMRAHVEEAERYWRRKFSQHISRPIRWSS